MKSARTRKVARVVLIALGMLAFVAVLATVMIGAAESPGGLTEASGPVRRDSAPLAQRQP